MVFFSLVGPGRRRHPFAFCPFCRVGEGRPSQKIVPSSSIETLLDRVLREPTDSEKVTARICAWISFLGPIVYSSSVRRVQVLNDDDSVHRVSAQPLGGGAMCVLSLSVRRSSFVQYITPFPRPSSDLLFSLFLIHHTFPPPPSSIHISNHVQLGKIVQDLCCCPSKEGRTYSSSLPCVLLICCCCTLVCSFLTASDQHKSTKSLMETWTLEARLAANKGVQPTTPLSISVPRTILLWPSTGYSHKNIDRNSHCGSHFIADTKNATQIKES